MKMHRDQIMTHFRYHWYIYIGIIAAALGIWVLVFSGILRTKENERLSVFCGFVIPGEDQLEEDLKADLIQQTGRRLDYIDMECYSMGAAMGANVFQMRAASGTDMFMLPENLPMMQKDPGQTYFAPIDTEILEKYTGPGVDYYMENGKVYGIRFHSGDGSRFAKYMMIEADSTYVLFISGKGVNLGGMYGTKEKNDFSLRAIAWLLEPAD